MWIPGVVALLTPHASLFSVYQRITGLLPSGGLETVVVSSCPANGASTGTFLKSRIGDISLTAAERVPKISLKGNR